MLERKMELSERLAQIRSASKQQNQHQNSIVLSAVEDTLRSQNSEFTPTAYFAALIALLNQYTSNANGSFNPAAATAVVYLLDIVTPHVPAPLLRSKFSPILTSLAPALTRPDVDAPFLRSAIGCLVSLLLAQDTQAWALPQSHIGPRRAVAGLLALATDPRPKVRKSAQSGLERVLQNGPPSPSLDHPAANMCAETALQGFSSVSDQLSNSNRQQAGKSQSTNHPEIIHYLQLIKAIASASGGWPTRNLDSLCDVLLTVTKSHNEFLNMAVFEVFEVVLEKMASEQASSKLPRLLEIVSDLEPALDDSQLFPPWTAVISRGYDVAGQVDADSTFQKLPEIFKRVSAFLAAPSHNVRVSAAECLVSFLVNCVPLQSILDMSIMEEKVLEKLAKIINDLFTVKYQASWPEVFKVVGAAFDAFKWRSSPHLESIVAVLGDLRASESFVGKKEADQILGRAVCAMGPENTFRILPLNLANPKPGQQGRAWLVPIVRDYVANTNLSNFKEEMIPLSENLYQRVTDHGTSEKTIEIKIYETLIQQIWSTLPGYCDRPLDVIQAFDQSFAEMLSNLLYQQPDLRVTICQGLQRLVMSFQLEEGNIAQKELLLASRISESDAITNLDHLANYSSNLLAVLFNVYSQTHTNRRGPILSCIDTYLSVTKTKDLVETFQRVCNLLESSIAEDDSKDETNASKLKKQNSSAPSMSHSLMDIMVAITIYLPRESFPDLFRIAARTISRSKAIQLQKKAYKLIPRLSQSDTGKLALAERHSEIQEMLLSSTNNVTVPARRDRLLAFSAILDTMPSTSLHFIPSILSEVILYTKETNERARLAAFNVLIQMGTVMQNGGEIDNAKVPTMSKDAPRVSASLEEYFTMLSAGLAGSTPHMVSATITGISRVLYHFMSSLSEASTIELVQTISLFFHSPNREIVGSVLGFVKVCVVSLPDNLIKPRIPELIPSLLEWSHEHKAHFRSKVKHILERIMRRFGSEIVERHTPEEGQKLIRNIRKTCERRKRKKSAVDDSDNETTAAQPNFEAEYDKVMYGSDDSAESADSEERPASAHKTHKQQPREQAYIIEDAEDPLDLLDRKTFGKISSRKPLSAQQHSQHRKRGGAVLDPDGKLIFREDDDEDVDMTNTEDLDAALNDENQTLEGGINAYIEAIKGRNAAQRGQRGKLKFSNRRSKENEDDEEDEEEVSQARSGKKGTGKTGRDRGRGGTGRGGRGRGFTRGHSRLHGSRDGAITKRGFSRR